MISRFGQLRQLLSCVIHLLRYGNKGIRFKHNDGGRAFVVCTGPSLNEVINQISDTDVVYAMNFFAMSDWFVNIKPRFYCLADSAFFSDLNGMNDRIDEVKNLYRHMDNVVDWDIQIIVPSRFRKAFEEMICFNNTHIRIVQITDFCFDGNAKIANFLYKRGWAAPRYQTVTIMALFCALNMGYKEVFLCGAEHNFMDNWNVDENNNLYISDSHFNTKDRNHLKSPLRGIISDSHSYVREQLEACYYIFHSHELLRDYADSIGSKIINTTLNSFIDVYEKQSLNK